MFYFSLLIWAPIRSDLTLQFSANLVLSDLQKHKSPVFAFTVVALVYQQPHLEHLHRYCRWRRIFRLWPKYQFKWTQMWGNVPDEMCLSFLCGICTCSDLCAFLMAMKPLAEKEEVIFCKNPATILNVSGRARLTGISEPGWHNKTFL